MTSGNGITHTEIEKIFDDEMNDDLKRNFVCVYLFDSITKYINFYDIIKAEIGKYPSAIFNTDRENKPGTHLLNFLDIHPKKKIFYYVIVLNLLALNSLL